MLKKALITFPSARDELNEFIQGLDEENSEILLNVFADYLPKFK
jgi:hypothetical protein